MDASIGQVRTIATAYIASHPQHKADIIDLAQMAVEEIQAGESADHEIELMVESIQELINA